MPHRRREGHLGHSPREVIPPPLVLLYHPRVAGRLKALESEWPGDANVFVAPVSLAKGASRPLSTPLRANGEEAINSRLRSYAERDDPKALESNAGVAVVGCFLRGDGFVLSQEAAMRARSS